MADMIEENLAARRQLTIRRRFQLALNHHPAPSSRVCFSGGSVTMWTI
jgi:hypothetical protein